MQISVMHGYKWHVSNFRGSVTVKVNATAHDTLRVDVVARGLSEETLNFIISSIEQVRALLFLYM